MFYKRTLTLLLLLSFSVAQETTRKKNTSTRIVNAPKIDGNIDDTAWEGVPICKDFVEFKPTNGKKVASEYATEVKVVYDDDALYISAKMLDPEPTKIPQQFASRDNFSQADFFLVSINPNDDGQNPFIFMVQATGNQMDAKVSNGEEDFNWNAVWESNIKITDYGWSVEIKIPYRALRFSNSPIQSWGFNFHRKLERLNVQHTWNRIDNTKGAWTQYDGLITDFKNIKPSTRLSLYPYASTTANTFSGKTEYDWSAGMDIKYGISENFTLDVTLIPDFSQASFDDVSLNLGPFEQEFEEQRQFFIEGTELFSKGDLFYSRRIGGSPIKSIAVKENERIIEEPQKVNMLNAVKVSGLTKNGWGIGFFNAITEKTEATIKNDKTGKTRTEVTNPFSNYNILVGDYQFNKNSSLTLVNTNVNRIGDFRDANTSGLLWHVEDKSSTYNIEGYFKLSDITDIQTPNKGYSFETSINKEVGNWQWELQYSFDNKDFDPNDMGILDENNSQRIYSDIGYSILQPQGLFNKLELNLSNNAYFQHYSGVFTGNKIAIETSAQLKSRFDLAINIKHFSARKDFNEPRHSKGNLGGIYFKKSQGFKFSHWGASNYAKKLAIEYKFFQTLFIKDKRHSYGFKVEPYYRFNNQISIKYGFKFNQIDNDRGFVDKDNDTEVYFGERKRVNYNNTLSGKYSFSTKSSVSLSFRHNWSKVIYNDNYFKLLKNGELASIKNFNKIKNINYNSWNVDLNYLWQFAPGSQLIAMYRNTINPDEYFASADLNLSDNLNALFAEEKQHTFSLRFVYFIDYATLKNVF